MVCVETDHWGDKSTTPTDTGKLKRGPRHQQPESSVINCAPPHFLSFDGSSAPNYDKGGQHRRRRMGTAR